MDKQAANAFYEDTKALRPQNLERSRAQLDAFVAASVAQQRRIALVTSGGTTVPLESRTVRYVDNFSTGTRGALCTEELLKAGFSVVFLHRKGSNFPFLTDIVSKLHDSPLDLVRSRAGGLDKSPAPSTERLLAVSFVTIFDYLFLLREACLCMNAAGRSALIILAAAVSDFYIPESEMAMEKIQSRQQDGLNISLRNVPKLLGVLRDWAPQAFVVSFKLETNGNILMAKGAGALVKYSVSVVCCNLLHNYREAVTIIWKDPAAPAVEVDAKAITGDEATPVAVRGICSRSVARGSHAAIDTPLIGALIEMHDAHIGQNEEPGAKRKRRAADEDPGQPAASPAGAS